MFYGRSPIIVKSIRRHDGLPDLGLGQLSGRPVRRRSLSGHPDGGRGHLRDHAGLPLCGGTYAAQSVAPNPTIFSGRARASVQFQQDLIILPTAGFPMGTLLDVRMLLAVAFSADALSAPAPFESGLVTTRFDARLVGSALGGGGSNRFFKSLPSTEIISGIALTGVEELVATVAVGFLIPFSAQIVIDAQVVQCPPRFFAVVRNSENIKRRGGRHSGVHARYRSMLSRGR